MSADGVVDRKIPHAVTCSDFSDFELVKNSALGSNAQEMVLQWPVLSCSQGQEAIMPNICKRAAGNTSFALQIRNPGEILR